MNEKEERDKALYVFKPDHGSQYSEESDVSDEGIFTTETTPEMRAGGYEEYVDDDAVNDRAAIEQMFQQALKKTTEPPTEKPQHKPRAISEVDIDDIAEKVRHKLEKYFRSTTTGAGQVNVNSQKQQDIKSAESPTQNKRQQQITTNNNNGDYKHEGDTSETTNNNDNNDNDNQYGQEAFINNNYKTVSYSYSNAKVTNNERESIENNNNHRQNDNEYSSLREAPHGHNNNKRQKTNAGNNNNEQQTYNNDETVQETYLNNNYKQVSANNNNNQPKEMNIKNNEEQQTNMHKKIKTGHKNKQRSNIRSDLQSAVSNVQLNEQKIIKNNPEINQDSPTDNHNYQQSEIQVSSPRIKGVKYRPHQQPDLAITEKSSENKHQKVTIPTNPEDMMVEEALVGAKGHDFYDEYKIPEKDENMFASVEKDLTKNIAREKPILEGASPKNQKKTTTVFKVVTENLNFDSNEKIVTTKKFKFTGLQKKSTYTVFHPEFPDKMPLIAVPYNFSEPIPEKDRIEDNKTFIIPPAKVNGKLSLV